ncbi:MAG: flagellar biosynthetic protein FliR [Candidatus Sericytochromatia bacterium]|nr:flagellar biosynthetic protein FliR [Candidatus Sericytochromatia bacterium]
MKDQGFAALIAWVTLWGPIFVLCFARTMAMSNNAPFWGAKTTPGVVRVAMGLTITASYLMARQPVASPYVNVFDFILQLISEVCVGLLFAFAANIITSAIQAAGEIIDVQMGLSMIMLLNPATKTQSTAMGRFFNQLATMVFVSTGAHLLLLGAFFHSFDLIPLGMSRWHDAALPATLVSLTAKVFAIGVQLAMPIIVVIFVVDFGLGIMNRVSPQINVLEMNNMIKPITGCFIVVMLLPTLIHLIGVLSEEMVKSSNEAMKAIAGPPGLASPKVPPGPPPGLAEGRKIP